MSFSSWLSDALLGSPIPPPNWLDPRNRRAEWESPPEIWGASLHPNVFQGRRGYRVPAARIAAELDEMSSCVNQPVVQGWAWLLALGCLGAVLLGFRDLSLSNSTDPIGFALAFGAIPFWFFVVAIAAYNSYDVELRQGLVCVRRWTDVWFGRPGRLVGLRRSVRAELTEDRRLRLDGDNDSVEVPIDMWPTSSWRRLEDRFEAWDIELTLPDGRGGGHPRHWNHGRRRRTRR